MTATVPPATEDLPAGALDSATKGASALDAMATTDYGRNLLAHALAQLQRDGWLRDAALADADAADVLAAELVRLDAMTWLGTRRGDRDHDEPISQVQLAERLAAALLRRLAAQPTQEQRDAADA